MKKLLDSDWLRAVQLKRNTSAKTVIPGQVTNLITYMKKLLDSDWLRAMQLKSKTSAKSVIPV